MSTLQSRAGLHMYVSRGEAHADSVGGLRVFYAPSLEGRSIAARRPCRGRRGEEMPNERALSASARGLVGPVDHRHRLRSGSRWRSR